MPTIPQPSTYLVKHIRINATADGDNTVIAAVTGKKLRILAYVFTATTAGVVAFKDSVTTFASFSPPANGGASYPGGVHAPAFETGTGEAFVVNTTASQDVVGHITYQEVI